MASPFLSGESVYSLEGVRAAHLNNLPRGEWTLLVKAAPTTQREGQWTREDEDGWWRHIFIAL